MSNQEDRPLQPVRDTADLPRAAVHSPTCLCGCALASYSIAGTPPQGAGEPARRAA